ncbi:MAG: hypothetical protein K6E17_01070 [Clostridiales bacterium]|nr:hypothetical protein [Clostridiales bacterium]
MIYGLIGEHLGHSFSAVIHGQIGREPYELLELAPQELETFLRDREFRGINVTIPYKQAVIPCLDEVSETAREIGAVNTIVNREGRLVGDNTDLEGITKLILRVCPDLKGRKTLVLGTGGTSRTAVYAARRLGADPVIRVSRTAREGAVSYADALRDHRDAEIIINTTPCGMYPNSGEAPLELEGFDRLAGVVDVIYNPLRTKLVLEARRRGIPAEGGLYMLVAQAVRAAEIFRNTEYPAEMTERIYRSLLREKENIVLTGMPGSGKSVVSAALEEITGRPAVDTDRLIVEKAGMEIPEIFRRFGEKHFRDLESEVIRELAPDGGRIISTGGGAVLRAENVEALRMNGRLFLLDRPLDELLPTDDRPLADSREKIERLYRERTPVYRASADEVVPVAGTPENVAKEIISR